MKFYAVRLAKRYEKSFGLKNGGSLRRKENSTRVLNVTNCILVYLKIMYELQLGLSVSPLHQIQVRHQSKIGTNPSGLSCSGIREAIC
jgi:hypothetical protein